MTGCYTRTYKKQIEDSNETFSLQCLDIVTEVAFFKGQSLRNWYKSVRFKGIYSEKFSIYEGFLLVKKFFYSYETLSM